MFVTLWRRKVSLGRPGGRPALATKQPGHVQPSTARDGEVTHTYACMYTEAGDERLSSDFTLYNLDYVKYALIFRKDLP